MRIAFVQDVNTFSVPIGTAIIAGVLRDKGHEVDLFVDENKIYNLRCFFSLLVQHPWLIPVIKPLFNINNKKLFWFIGTVLDGYYIKKGIVYKQTFGEFIGNVIHYFKNYRTSRKLSKESYGISS
tara:strand:+ start:209 stop:583 length:375 start_codon:yes stop_codon:yes gene_type:complete